MALQWTRMLLIFRFQRISFFLNDGVKGELITSAMSWFGAFSCSSVIHGR
ncbi:TPA: hypothetical protein ACHWKL_004648 [Providencia stuartii]|uniref:Uncharacterized protein n=1 Tax=Providencia stuartii ATCC 25827 TaxID=471874 RepID=A0AA87CR82_PROST|nr:MULTISPECIES: hypothetical protein [Providencia]EDU59672.1 hypothetical protein PROSTU_02863 [Providencia stuartii ATCC 25827]EMD1715857.1 hypothetical protein [Providencia stuartii]MBG5907331.1 hypothetical protein [Providencia stuartii]MBN5557023.1 hypothetical protein [Providencia stuartii]MBN5560912.1 hypothetical protein [Providencia stuartii]